MVMTRAGVIVVDHIRIRQRIDIRPIILVPNSFIGKENGKLDTSKIFGYIILQERMRSINQDKY